MRVCLCGCASMFVIVFESLCVFICVFVFVFERVCVCESMCV